MVPNIPILMPKFQKAKSIKVIKENLQEKIDNYRKSDINFGNQIIKNN